MRTIRNSGMVVLAVALVFSLAGSASAVLTVFDDFNTNEGHFNLAPTFSGSTTNVAATSTADRVTTEFFEGGASQQLIINATTAGSPGRVRHLSGGGTIANNTPINVLGPDGPDGWIGLAVKTDVPDWTVQLWLEGPENNGGVPKPVVADGQWHIYEWNLDDISGGPDGWGQIAGIIAGDADVEAGSYTIDSVIFRHPALPATSTIFMDWVARNDAGHLMLPGSGGDINADFNDNGFVDAADYAIWRDNVGTGTLQPQGDADGDGDVDNDDYGHWKATFGTSPSGGGSAVTVTGFAVPEPATLSLLVLAVMGLIAKRQRSK